MPRAKKQTRKKAKKAPQAKKATKATKKALEKALGTTQLKPQDIIEPDDFQEYAPPAGVTPLAKGETIETAPTKGAVAKQDQPVKAPTSPSDASEAPAGTTDTDSISERLRKQIKAEDTDMEKSDGYVYETLNQLIDAIGYLQKRDKRLASKDKQILKLRIERARKVQRRFN